MILLQLWTHDGLTQSDLADLICVEPPTISKMLHRMEAEGLVERRADDDDGRVSRVFLSASSRTIEHAVAQSWAAVEERATAGMTAEERMLLRRLLIQMRENLS
jgi:DNA-binding MarR family transcriptional regulator